MRALITGVSGFAGSHLAERLLDESEYELWGVVRSGMGHATTLAERISIHQLDLIDPVAVRELLATCRPARIYHLAAQAFVPLSWKDPWPTLENNIRAQLNLLQAIVELELETRILCVTSMEVYGKIRAESLPINESTAFLPASPYGVSKIAQDMLALQYFQSYGIHTIRARPFNHIGPRQNERFVASSFAKQIADIEVGYQPPTMMVGNLSAQRDFSDVRDVVRAYHLLIEKGTAGEAYNIGRGQPNSIQTLLDTLRRLTPIPIDVRTDPARLRPSDVPVSYADISKIQAATGWTPEISFESSLRDVLNDWRQRIA